jgi:hypothetical protein
MNKFSIKYCLKMVLSLEVTFWGGPKLKSDFFCTALYFFYFAGHLIGFRKYCNGWERICDLTDIEAVWIHTMSGRTEVVFMLTKILFQNIILKPNEEN